MPVNPVTGERLPYPGDSGYTGGPQMEGPRFPSDNLMPPGPMGGPPPMGGQEQRLSQLLEARQMIDQEIAAIVGGPPGAENLDMLPPPPMDPMMPPEAMMAQGGPPMPNGPPMGQPMPPMGPQGLLGM